MTLFRALFFLPLIAVAFLIGLSLAEDKAGSVENQIPATKQTKEQLEFYEKKVEPLLKKHCHECHAGEKIKGGLRLTSQESVFKGGDSGSAVDFKNPAKSLLLEAINYASLEMPPKGKLPAKEREILTRWVNLGAPMTQRNEVVQEEKHAVPQVNAETKAFWSFQKVKRPPLPAVKNSEWVKQPVDAFVLAKLTEAGLQPNGPAAKEQLLRRAYYDIIGLPPTPKEVANFLNDDSPQAWEKVVDELLDSPHYGERWARHWLDLVRYAESNSYERDDAKPFVWRYRDYVIRSLNEDKPYTQFIREQLAGDELEQVTPESIIATGYYRLGIWDDEPVDHLQALYDDLDDILATTGQVFLGLTVNCARCHDHKLDPIPQKDYYRMLAFFRNFKRFGIRGGNTVADNSIREIGTPEAKQRHEAEIKAHQEKVAVVEKEIQSLEEKVKSDFLPVEHEDFKYDNRREDLVGKRVGKQISKQEFQQYVLLRKQRDRLKLYQPTGLGKALCVKEFGPDCPPTHLLIRGNAHAPGDEVQPGFPSVLGFDDPDIPKPPAGSATTQRRIVFANWVASDQNPLTARVMVNRIWQQHFGNGIVTSPNNFGLQGVAPTHPELLDWLAAEFMANGWKFKPLHKLLLMSSAYQMSSEANPEGLEKDSENQLLWRSNMRRLSAEEIRDSILAVNGSLNRAKMFGPSIYPIMPAEVLAGQSRPGAGWGKSSPEERARRSIYIHTKRSLVHPLMANFDVPDTDSTCPVRFSTTQPTQALGMLNSQFLNEQAQVFTDYVKQKSPDSLSAQVALCLERTLQRKPTVEEIKRGLTLINTLQEKHAVSEEFGLRCFCLVALNLNEFLYLD